jgi:hypothetical protein
MKGVYTKENILNLIKEGCEITVDYDDKTTDKLVPERWNGRGVMVSRYPAILTMRLFPDWIKPIPPSDAISSSPES